jgi:hypothetical protein
MATYPQGVSTFIPDYQPYQPDLNFTANILQLKQTQYDQNWQKLNSMYGQILNAPLTHDESVKRRDNTFKRIDFDLKRITGLDLSLDQNVQQATQLFRPFYEDASLMKDMVFTKNASFERSLGEGKRYNTDEKVNSEYWADGLRAIDYKMQEFKETPYDQLPGFGDVKYTPYVNVEKMAMELADKLNYKVKRTSVEGDWIVTEQNGEQIVGPLQSIFYSIIGKDPKVREMYATQAYLDRKDYVMANKDKPEFNGNAQLAEQKYLTDALDVLRKQTTINKNALLSEKQTNDKIIDQIEESIRNGDDILESQQALERYKDANTKIDQMLKDNEYDLSLITDNSNSTSTTQGGTTLDLKNIQELRSRVDAVTSSNFLQADLDRAVTDFAYNNYIKDIEANPYAVQRQKFQYDSSLIQQRAAAQKDVALFKHNLALEKELNKAKEKSGLYTKDPKTGELKEKPELHYAQEMKDLMTSTEQTDPKKIMKDIGDLFKTDAVGAQKALYNTLNEMRSEGLISNDEIGQIFKGTGKSGFDKDLLYDWLQSNRSKNRSPKRPKGALGQLGFDVGEAYMEKKSSGNNSNKEIGLLMNRLAGQDLDEISPDYLANMSTKMLNLVSKKVAVPAIRNSPNVKKLVELSWGLGDYAALKKEQDVAKVKFKEEVIRRAKADGYNYARYWFDENNNMVSSVDEFKANIARHKPNHIIKDDGMSWGGFWSTVAGASSVGAGVGGVGTAVLGPGAAVGAGIGGLIGAAGGALSYLGTGLIESAYNNFFSSEPDSYKLKYGKPGFAGTKLNLTEEFEALKESYLNNVESSLYRTKIPGLPDAPGSQELSWWTDNISNPVYRALGMSEQGTGLYTNAGVGIKVTPGLMSPTFNHFLEVKNALKGIAFDEDTEETFVTLNGVEDKYDNVDDPKANLGIFKALYGDMLGKIYKKDSGLGDVMVSVSPFASQKADKAAVNFKFSSDYLKKFKKEKDGSGFLDGAAMTQLLTNGLTVITNADKLSGVTMYKNSFETPEQLRIKKSGKAGVTYKDPTVPGYAINFRQNAANPKNLDITQFFPVYDPETRTPRIVTNTTTGVNMGYNIVSARSRFFNEDAPALMKQQILKMQQYGRK